MDRGERMVREMAAERRAADVNGLVLVDRPSLSLLSLL